MGNLESIKEPVKEHFKNFEQFFRQEMSSGVRILNTITGYLYRRKGKQLRPLLVLLSAGATARPVEKTYRAATLIELLHTATLVHDDVVDDSNRRRGFFSINALWKNKVAVLTGDYLLAKGLLLATENEDFDLLRIVSGATREMAEGELIQIEKARRLDIEESVYFDIISKKTASLTSACCEAGAVSAGAGPEAKQALAAFGRNLGIAFQLKDDLFDYQKGYATGKPNGLDIKEKKMTLPLIYYIRNLPFLERKAVIANVRLNHNNPRKMEKIMQKVSKSGAFEYTAEKMEHYRISALDALRNLPTSPSRLALEELLEFSISRKS